MRFRVHIDAHMEADSIDDAIEKLGNYFLDVVSSDSIEEAKLVFEPKSRLEIVAVEKAH